MAPASTTVCANSGECFEISLRSEAAILFKAISGSWIQSTKRGTASASTTACDSSVGPRKVIKVVLLNVGKAEGITGERFAMKIYLCDVAYCLLKYNWRINPYWVISPKCYKIKSQQLQTFLCHTGDIAANTYTAIQFCPKQKQPC
uniref:Uncharacterized protein n=1 Tax=Molossus molossus TaxID=27622 RepID=A0A7J8JXM2_MOLMO|nr:hypothetical protein HJG59_007907 [Molossus molossus]